MITGHFINEEWDLKAINVGTFCASDMCDSPHITAEDLVSTTQNYLSDLEIDGKISFFVTDGEARELKFARILGYPSNWCIDHIISLSVKESISDVDIVKTIRDVVSLFNYSDVGKEYLSRQQGDNPKKLLQDDGKKWFGCYTMLERAFECRDAIKNAYIVWKSRSNDIETRLPQPEDWSIVKEVIEILKPLYQAHKHFEQSKFVTISTMIPILRRQIQILENYATNKRTLKKIIKTLVDGLKQRVNLPIEISVSSFLDPRTKKLNGYTENEKNIIYDWVKSKIPDFLTQVEIQSEKTSLSYLLPSEETTKSEFESYFDEIQIGINDNPLVWWRVKESQYPNISKLARKLLCIQSTTGYAESNFSNLTFIINDLRTSLKPKTVCQLLFLKSNSQLNI